MPKNFFQSANDDRFYFHIKANNGEIVAQSEAYQQMQGAERGYDALLRAVQDDVLALPTYILIAKGTELGQRVFKEAQLYSEPANAIDRAYDIIGEQDLQVEYTKLDALERLTAGDTLVLVDIEGEGDVIILKRTTQQEE